MIVECRPTVVGARDDEPLPRHVNELHLVRLEPIDRYDDGLPGCRFVDFLLLPFPSASVAMVDAQLVAAHQHSAEPTADCERRSAYRLEYEHRQTGLGGDVTAQPL